MSSALNNIDQAYTQLLQGAQTVPDDGVVQQAEKLFFEESTVSLGRFLGVLYFFKQEYLLAYVLLKEQSDPVSRFYWLYSLVRLGYSANARVLYTQYGGAHLFEQREIADKQKIRLAFLLGLENAFHFQAEPTDVVTKTLLGLLKDFKTYANDPSVSATLFRTGDQLLLNELDRRKQPVPPKPAHAISEHYFDDGFLKLHSNSTVIGNNMYLLKIQNTAVIIDCGADTENDTIDFDKFFREAGVSKNEICAVFFTHAHLDHIGNSHKLLRYLGPHVPCYLTKDTQKLASFGNQIHLDGPQLRFVSYNQTEKLSEDVDVSFVQNGHILGSVALIFRSEGKKILFTSDFCLHRQHTAEKMNLQQVISFVGNKIDYLIMESTYGKKRDSVGYEDNVLLLQKLVALLKKYNKKVFMPAYAIGRTQEIINILDFQNYPDENLPRFSLTVLGSAYDVTLYYRQLQKCTMERLYAARENAPYCDATVASSGMLLEGSESYNFMGNLLDNSVKDFAFIQTGYMPPNRKGSELITQWKKNHNLFFEVGLSAHASHAELWQLIDSFEVGQIITIHGDGLAE